MKTRSNYPAKPKAPSAKAGLKAWEVYKERLRRWKSTVLSIRAILSGGKKKSHKKKGRR